MGRDVHVRDGVRARQEPVDGVVGGVVKVGRVGRLELAERDVELDKLVAVLKVGLDARARLALLDAL